MRKLAILLFMAMVAMTAVSANAGVAGELGILDLTANGGINPNTGVAWQVGDQYRLAFHTDGTIDATSNDPGVYDAFATAEAARAGVGGTWTAMVYVNTDGTQVQGVGPVSSPVDRSDTGDFTDGAGQGGAGVPVYAMDGSTSIARNNADIYNSWSNPFDSDATIRLASGSTNNDSDGNPVTASQNVYYAPFLDQFGLGDTANIHGSTNWTGGFGSISNPLGDTTNEVRASNGNSNANNAGRVWNRFQADNTTSLGVYAISDVLTVMDASAAKIVSPADGAYAITAVNPLTLSWTCPDSNEVASVYADVWFSTDPCALGAVTLPNDGLDAKTAGVDASAPNTYYWRVDVTVGDANTVEGDIWSFTTTLDALPVVVIDPLEIMTWSDQAVQLDATIDDNDEADVTFIWTASPDGLDDLNLTVDFVATDEDPVVTVTNDTGSMVTVTMTLTATDAHGDVEASSKIEVYSDACDMAKNGENIPVALTDLNADCVTDLGDLAIMAAAWLEGYASTEPK